VNAHIDGSGERVVFVKRGAGDYVSVHTDDVTVTVPEAAPDAATAPSSSRQRLRVGLGIATGDLLALLVALVLSGVLGAVRVSPWFAAAIVVTAWLPLVGTLGSSSSGMIAGRLGAQRVVGATAMVATVIAVFGGPSTEGPRLGAFVVLLVAGDLLQRAAWATYARSARRKGRLRLRTALVGTGDEPTDFLALLHSESSDLLPVARIAVRSDDRVSDALPVHRGFTDLERMVARGEVDCLLIASSAVDRDELALLRRLARTSRLHLRMFTKAPEALSSHLDVFPLGPGALVTVLPARLRGFQLAVKRTMDIVGSIVGLFLVLPIMLVTALMIRSSSPGPVLFRQRRVTRSGRIFRIAKFRTMITDVDSVLEGRGIDATQPFFKPREELVVTPIGRVLRALSLDELPQLWNVLKGDMSLVGPRPLPVEQVVANPELLEGRHDVRAGITGWWQVNGRSDVPADEAVRQDLFYIENWSVGLDVRILFRTIGALLRRRGAY
jgi:exopolysaccharide biosynthesis polyprenyl glycosylphosphotransferase